MIEFMTFDITTGELLQTMLATDIHLVDAQCTGDVDYVLGHWDRTNHVVRDGEVVLRESISLPQPADD